MTGLQKRTVDVLRKSVEHRAAVARLHCKDELFVFAVGVHLFQCHLQFMCRYLELLDYPRIALDSPPGVHPKSGVHQMGRIWASVAKSCCLDDVTKRFYSATGKQEQPNQQRFFCFGPEKIVSFL